MLKQLVALSPAAKTGFCCLPCARFYLLNYPLEETGSCYRSIGELENVGKRRRGIELSTRIQATAMVTRTSKEGICRNYSYWLGTIPRRSNHAKHSTQATARHEQKNHFLIFNFHRHVELNRYGDIPACQKPRFHIPDGDFEPSLA